MASPKRIAGISGSAENAQRLEQALASVKGQFDRVHVYLNGFDTMPDSLADPAYEVFLDRDFETLGPEGGLFRLEHMAEEHGKALFFLLDEQTLYPPDYAEHMARALEKYQYRVAACVSGAILARQVHHWYERCAQYGPADPLPTDRFVSLAGSDSLTFCLGAVRARFSDFYMRCDHDPGAAFSLLAKNQGLPLVCAARPGDWLKSLSRAQEHEALATRELAAQARTLGQWDFEAFAAFTMPVLEDVFPGLDQETARDKRLDLEYIQCARQRAQGDKSATPRNWQPGEAYHRSVRDWLLARRNGLRQEVDALRGRERAMNRQFFHALINRVKKRR